MVDGDIFKLSEVIQSIKESPSLLVAVMCDTAANYSKQFNERIIIGSGGGSVSFLRHPHTFDTLSWLGMNGGIIICCKNMCLKHLTNKFATDSDVYKCNLFIRTVKL